MPITIFLFLPASVTYIAQITHLFMWMYMILYTSCYIRKPVKTELTFVFES